MQSKKAAPRIYLLGQLFHTRISWWCASHWSSMAVAMAINYIQLCNVEVQHVLYLSHGVFRSSLTVPTIDIEVLSWTCMPRSYTSYTPWTVYSTIFENTCRSVIHAGSDTQWQANLYYVLHSHISSFCVSGFFDVYPDITLSEDVRKHWGNLHY